MALDRYNELVEAGAPELPEGLFYRVRAVDTRYFNLYEVEVRRRGRWGSDRLGRCLVELSDYPDHPVVSVLAAACETAWTESETRHRDALRRSAAETFLGDHP